MVQSVIFNSTHHSFKTSYGPFDGLLPHPMERVWVHTDTCSTYFEFELLLSVDMCHRKVGLFLSSDDLLDYRVITICQAPDSGRFFWKGILRGSRGLLHGSEDDWAAFDLAKKEVLTKMKTVVNMEELLKQINIFHSQCNYFVQVFLKGIQEVKREYLVISEYNASMWVLYMSQKLSKLISSLDSLLCTLMSAERLLQACGGKKWERVALVLSMPLPEVEKYSGSKFSLLIRDFNWSLDIIQYALRVPDAPQVSSTTIQTLSTRWLNSALSRDLAAKEFEWCDYRCRYVLQRSMHAFGVTTRVAIDEAESHEDDVDQQALDCKDKIRVAVDEVEALAGDFGRQAIDRKELPDIVEKNFTAHKHSNSVLRLARHFFSSFVVDETSRNKFSTVLKSRCQDTSGSGSRDSVSKCFEIDYLDVKLKKPISRGGFKHIYRANWLGLEVAVAMVGHVSRDVVEKEAGFLVKVHHPNVVDFFGFALKEDALTEEEKNAVEEVGPKWTGYLLMELMQEDLRSLIDKILRGPGKQESGGPFPLSVTIDVLLQIVAAMIHTQKCEILHRDLKAKNCLVSPKPAPKSTTRDAPTLYYTVKVIDFGESKLRSNSKDGKHTKRKGTSRWMAPEVWQSSEYSGSADVYSFGMTCYEIVTGLIPFQGIGRDVMEKVLEGTRPKVPGTCPQSLNDLMRKCWTHEPKERPTFEAIQRELWAIKYSVEVEI